MLNPLVKYKAYHKDKVNVTIHMSCVPLLLMSIYSILPIYISFGINIFYSINYTLFDVFSTKSIHSVYYLQFIYLLHFVLRKFLSVQTNVGIHIISWVLQIIGHKFFENNSPAFFDNLYESFLFAPYFTFLETFYPSSFESKNKYTILKNDYDTTKKSIIYFAGLFQNAQKEYNSISNELASYNHIYINTNFGNNDIYKDILAQIIDELREFDIECIVGFSLGGSLSLQFKQVYMEKTNKELKCVLISPGGFQGKTFLENSIRIISKYLYSLYRNDKWYMIQNYPIYQNTSILSSTDYIIVSTSDTVHYPGPIQTHENRIILKHASHLSMIPVVRKQKILSQLIRNDYQIEKISVKPLTSNLNKFIFGGHFYPYHISLWVSVSSYNVYYFIQNGYSYVDLCFYGLLTLIIGEFNEYAFHRFALHHLLHKHHNKHHTYPNKLSIIHTPALLIILLIVCTYLLIHKFTNKKIETISLIFGPTYFLLFEFTHLISHSYKGSNNIMVNAKYYHKLHHIDDTVNYGFITPIWDYIFGTLSSKYNMSFLELLFGFIPFASFFIHKKTSDG